MIRRILSFFVVLIAIVTSGFVIYQRYYSFKVVLNGDEKILVSYKSTYDDPLFYIDQSGSKIDCHESEYEILSDVDTSTLGEYIVNYRIKYKGKSYELKRYVNVVDNTPPEISVNVDEVEKDYCSSKVKTDYKVGGGDLGHFSLNHN